MTSHTELAMTLARSALKEQAARIAELEEALRRTTEMLSSACYFVTKNNGLMLMLEAVDRARSVLNKEKPRG